MLSISAVAHFWNLLDNKWFLFMTKYRYELTFNHFWLDWLLELIDRIVIETCIDMLFSSIDLALCTTVRAKQTDSYVSHRE